MLNNIQKRTSLCNPLPPSNGTIRSWCLARNVLIYWFWQNFESAGSIDEHLHTIMLSTVQWWHDRFLNNNNNTWLIISIDFFMRQLRSVMHFVNVPREEPEDFLIHSYRISGNISTVKGFRDKKEQKSLSWSQRDFILVTWLFVEELD